MQACRKTKSSDDVGHDLEFERIIRMKLMPSRIYFFLMCRWSKKNSYRKKRFAEKFAAVKVIFYEYECNNRSIKF